MNKIFNTTFEISMRLLLALSVTHNTERTLDYIVTADFISNYAKEFGISNSNLHGDNEFSYSEFSTRRSISYEALKKLVLQDLVHVSQSENGFKYFISDIGLEFCKGLHSDYAVEYKKLIEVTNAYMKNKTEKELLNLISQEAAKSIRKEL